MNLTVSEALALSARQRTEWCLLVFVTVDGDLCPTYLCTACGAQRITLQTHGRELPHRCPKCGAERATPPPSTHPVARDKRQAPYPTRGNDETA